MKLNYFFISLAALLTLGFMSFTISTRELNLRRLDLNTNVRFSLDSMREQANFTKLADTEKFQDSCPI